MEADIFNAIYKNDIGHVLRYIDQGWGFRVRDSHDQSIILIALVQCRYRILKLFLKAGAGINMDRDVDINHKPICWACKYKHNIKIVKNMLRYGVDPNVYGKYDFPALHEAIYSGRTDIFWLFVNYSKEKSPSKKNVRVDLDIQDKDGMHTIYPAIIMNNTEIINYFLNLRPVFELNFTFKNDILYNSIYKYQIYRNSDRRAGYCVSVIADYYSMFL